MNGWTILGLAIGSGFLLGSIPTGYIAGRLRGGLDLREVGSGNLGATNVFRNLGLVPGVVVMLLDIGKGSLAAFVGLSLLPALSTALPDLTGLMCALAAVLGHSLSPWMGFRGGKGVATAAGAFLVLAPLPGLGTLLVWAILLATTRVMSVASLAGAVVLPVTLALVELVRPDGEQRRWATLILGVVIGVWVIWRHRSNIDRLRDGTESKLW
ncbi:acyl-phosphate glycerol 3-phosphate acyltransferase [bacterium]|nr:MAG: acyl-phosphate glycerol 3-phosphate acyltransferase [bacterium]